MHLCPSDFGVVISINNHDITQFTCRSLKHLTQIGECVPRRGISISILQCGPLLKNQPIKVKLEYGKSQAFAISLLHEIRAAIGAQIGFFCNTHYFNHRKIYISMKASVFKWAWSFAGQVGAFLQKHAKSIERCHVPKKDGGLVSTLYVHLVDISISWTTSSARPFFSSMHSCPSRPDWVSSPDVRHNVRPRRGSSSCCLSGLHCRIQITLPKLQMSCIPILLSFTWRTHVGPPRHGIPILLAHIQPVQGLSTKVVYGEAVLLLMEDSTRIVLTGRRKHCFVSPLSHMEGPWRAHGGVYFPVLKGWLFLRRSICLLCDCVVIWLSLPKWWLNWSLTMQLQWAMY